MAHTYTPNSNPLTTITVPDDGDVEIVASVNPALQALADAVAEARSHLDGSPVDTTIGASADDALLVRASAEFQEPVTLSGGASLSVSGTMTVTDTLTTNGDLEVSGIAEFHGTTTIGDTAGDTLNIDATSIVNAPATFKSDVVLGDASSDSIQVNGTVNLNAKSTAHEPVTLTSAGRIQYRTYVMSDSDVTDRGPSNTDIVRVATLTGDRTLTIFDPDIGDGTSPVMVFSNLTSSTHFLVVKDPGGSILISLKGNSGSFGWAEVVRMGGAWLLLKTGVNP